MQTEINSSLKSAWLSQHKRQLPIVIAFAGLYLIIFLIAHLISPNTGLFEFDVTELVLICDVIILPLAAINSVFFMQRLFKRYVNSGWKMVALKLPAVLLGVLLMSLLLEWVYVTFGYVDDDIFVFGDFQASPQMSNVITNTFAALVIGLPIFIWQLRIQELNLKLKEKEMEQERLIQLKTQAELHALQSRINPHFLFNSFNSIASLISTDPDRAEKMMVQLSDLFRYSLNYQESNFVTIKEELKIVETYLGIEKIRFGENLDYQINLPVELNSQLIPRFLIQPLVENAVKHATSKIKQVEIWLELSEQKETITIKLSDNGLPFPKPIDRGYGIQSTYDKLNLLYPEQHSIDFLDNPDKQIRITLKKQSQNEAKI